MRQAVWQIYLHALEHIPKPTFDVESPNVVHQADLLFLPYDRSLRVKKVYKYALTVVNVASTFKAAEPLTSKDSSDVSKTSQTIYNREPLRWPKVLHVDPGHEFTWEVTKHYVKIRRENVNVQGDQEIIERFNRTLGERLFAFQYSKEMNFKERKTSTDWVKRLPEVVLALNSKFTRLIGNKSCGCHQRQFGWRKQVNDLSRLVGPKEKRLDSECEISLSRWWAGRRSEASPRANLVTEGLQFR